MPTIDIDREAAHEAALRELNKPVYPKASLMDQLGDWINELLYRLLLKGSQVPGGWLTIIVLAIIVVIVIIVAIRIIASTMRTNRGGRYELFGPTELSAAEHRATAEQYAARAEWAAAIRHRLRAVARQLEETGTLDPVPGRTAGELARDAGLAIPALVNEFTRSAKAFNDVTYGELPGTPQAYQLIVDLDEHLRSRTAVAQSDDSDASADSWAQVR